MNDRRSAAGSRRPSWSRLTPCMTSIAVGRAHRARSIDAVRSWPHQLLHRGAQLPRDPPCSRSAAARALAAARTAPGPPRRASCRAWSPAAPRRRRRRCSATGSSCADQQLAHLVAQLPGARQSQRREQPEPDRLAVAVARVSGDGLDRVADRVAEVEHLPQSAVAFVLRDDPQLCQRAARRSPRGRPAAPPRRTRSHSSPPAISAVLTTSA